MAAAHVKRPNVMAKGVMLFWVVRLSVRSKIFQERHVRIPSNLAQTSSRTQRGNDWILVVKGQGPHKTYFLAITEEFLCE